jgi:hypothetical protein
MKEFHNLKPRHVQHLSELAEIVTHSVTSVKVVTPNWVYLKLANRDDQSLILSNISLLRRRQARERKAITKYRVINETTIEINDSITDVLENLKYYDIIDNNILSQTSFYIKWGFDEKKKSNRRNNLNFFSNKTLKIRKTQSEPDFKFC